MKRTITTCLSGVVLSTLIIQSTHAYHLPTPSETFIGTTNKISTLSNKKNNNNPPTFSPLKGVGHTNAAADIIKISQIQGEGSASPMIGQIVTTEGIVVGDFQGSNELEGYFLQDTIGDNNVATSDGIFVLDANSSVSIGDYLQITGTVAEVDGQTILSDVTVVSTPAKGLRAKDTVEISFPLSGSLEPFEGMLVTIPQTLTVTDVNHLGAAGEVVLSSGGRLSVPTQIIDPNDADTVSLTTDGKSNAVAVKSFQDENNNRRIILDDGSAEEFPIQIKYLDENPDKTLRNGSTVIDLTGVLSFSNNNYKIQPVGNVIFTYNPRPAVPALGNANIKIASFNVLNLFNGNGQEEGFPAVRGASSIDEYEKQLEKIVSAITSLNADVIGLMEIENDGNSDTSAIFQLVNALNAGVPDTYAFINDPAGINGTTGKDLVKQALIYKPAVVTPVGASRADSDASNPRPSIAQVFQVAGKEIKFAVVVNHFKSKICDGALTLDTNQQDGQGCFNAQRKDQSTALLAFTESIKEQAEIEDVLVIGDLNAYTQEDPIEVLIGGGLKKLGINDYSYVFNGEAGALDHALATESLSKKVTGAAYWHINADEPRVLDYNEDDDRSLEYYENSPYRSSDHDPIIVGLNLSEPTAISKMHSKNLGLHFAPNPATDRLIITWNNNASGNGTIVIKNALNQQILTIVQNFADGKNELEIPLNNLKAGVYFMDVISEKEIKTGRFVIAE